MKKIVLISCSSKKKLSRTQAKNVYVSPLFNLSMRYAMKLRPDAIFILSAKHGLLNPVTEIDPYDVTLSKMSIIERRAWAKKVLKELGKSFNLQQDHFIILAGKKYRQFLITNLGFYDTPLDGLPIGKQLQYLKRQIKNE